MMYFLIAFLVSSFVALIILLTEVWHYRHTHDHDVDGVQKFHDQPTPRIGGVAILAGLAAGCWWLGQQLPDTAPTFLLWWGLAVLPAFGGGLAEDLTKRVSPRDRLFMTFLAAAIAFYALDAALVRIGIGWFDTHILGLSAASLVLTVVMAGGVAHAVNIIDGFHGLMLGVAGITFAALGFVARSVGDVLLAQVAWTAIGALFGLFLFNFPRGRIFAGDGGSYLVGFVLATMSLLLVARNPGVSPWFPLLLLIYPVFETVFSIIRRWKTKAKIGQPDARHLHSLLYRRVVPRLPGYLPHRRNAMTSPLLWLLNSVNVVPSFFVWNSTAACMTWTALFVVVYLRLYHRLVRFRWLRSPTETEKYVARDVCNP